MATAAYPVAFFMPAQRARARIYGDGSVVDCLSVDISDWEKRGTFTAKGKTALATDSTVAAHNVNVETRDGVVQPS